MKNNKKIFINRFRFFPAILQSTICQSLAGKYDEKVAKLKSLSAPDITVLQSHYIIVTAMLEISC